MYYNCSNVVGVNYNERYKYISGVSLYLKMYGFIIIIEGRIDNISIILMQYINHMQYFKIIIKIQLESAVEKYVTILQKIREFDNKDKVNAKQLCNWIT